MSSLLAQEAVTSRAVAPARMPTTRRTRPVEVAGMCISRSVAGKGRPRSWQLGMGSVTERLAARMLAAAEKHGLGLRRVILDGRKFAALVGAVAERLVPAAAAGAPPIALALGHVEAERRPLRDGR